MHGGRALAGTVKISGSKNSALPILAATLLTKEPCVIHRVPDLSDVHYMLQILNHLGAEVERASGVVTVTAEKVSTVAPYDVVRKMRASVSVLGPLLGREKKRPFRSRADASLETVRSTSICAALNRWERPSESMQATSRFLLLSSAVQVFVSKASLVRRCLVPTTS